jgi:hypothetical protein
MTTVTVRHLATRTPTGRWAAIVAIVALLVLTAWAATAGRTEQAQPAHRSPGTVEAVGDSEFSLITLTPGGAEKIGLDVIRVERTGHPAGRLVVPDSALVYGADGTTWVYASAGDPLRFRRQVVHVAAVDGPRAILSHGPAAGTAIASVGSAELYGTEFEVGH